MTPEQKKQQSEDIEKMRVFFEEIWGKKLHRSEVSDTWLGTELKSLFFHHILPKSKYPELKYEYSNIILLTGDEHQIVENDIYRYNEVNIRRDRIKKQFGIV